MIRTHFGRFATNLVLAAVWPAMAAADDNLRILTFPIGLVADEHPIDVDLGGTGGLVELLLDGARVCTFYSGATQCIVDFGEAPQVHLLELVRRNDAGRIVENARRWVNLPGQEAELDLLLEATGSPEACRGWFVWSHPSKLDPSTFIVALDGSPVGLSNDRLSFEFPCSGQDGRVVVTASAVFPDGLRAEAVEVVGGFSQNSRVDVTAVPLVGSWSSRKDCEGLAASVGEGASLVENAGTEVVFVLDPGAGYRRLLGSPGGTIQTGTSWRRAEATLHDAERIWFVVPDAKLHRIDGYSSSSTRLQGFGSRGSKTNWLKNFFAVGGASANGEIRLADAVAASGLVAAAGPRRRAVVVVLGNAAVRDASRFTAWQARQYLGEIGVPLVVLRIGKPIDDGWPEGIRVRSMDGLTRALRRVDDEIHRQCVMWIEGDRRLEGLVASLPDGIDIAGWSDLTAPERAPADDPPYDRTMDGSVAVGAAGAAAENIEVTAVRVLLVARGADGSPVENLAPQDLRVAENEREVKVLGLKPIAGGRGRTLISEAEVAPSDTAQSRKATRMPVTIYVERQISGSADLGPPLNALAGRTVELTNLGPVSLVKADTRVETVLDNSDNPAEVEQILRALSGEPAGSNAIERIRTEYLRDGGVFGSGGRRAGDGGPDGGSYTTAMAGVRRAVFEEDALIRQSLERMNDWALSVPGSGPRLLVVVGMVFDSDPLDFYLRFLALRDPSLAPAARGELLAYQQAGRIHAVGCELAGAGWHVVPIAARVAGKLRRVAEFSGEDIIRAIESGSSAPEVDFMLVDPIGAQRQIAAPSGGDVAMGKRGIEDLLSGSGGWYLLTYQVARPPDGQLHELDVECIRNDVRISSSSVVASGTSEGRAAMRVRNLLTGEGDTGELLVRLTFGAPRGDSGDRVMADLTVSVDFGSVENSFVEGGARVLRYSIAVQAESGKTSILHELQTADGRLAGQHFTAPVRWPGGPVRVAVAVEDLASGAWGGIIETFSR